MATLNIFQKSLSTKLIYLAYSLIEYAFPKTKGKLAMICTIYVIY